MTGYSLFDDPTTGDVQYQIRRKRMMGMRDRSGNAFFRGGGRLGQTKRADL